MKQKIVFFICLFFALSAKEAKSQFRDNLNLSVFAGGYAAQQNTNNHGDWYGTYLEYMPIKADGWNLGFCAVASRVEFKSNTKLARYDGSELDFAGGLAGGKYVEYLNMTHSAYFGANIMYKHAADRGVGLSGNGQTLGRYESRQNDNLLSAELNLNFLKSFGVRENLFPRTQLRLTYQLPLSASKEATWNGKPISGLKSWQKDAYSAELKQSLYQIGRFNTLVEPKLIGGYYYYYGDRSEWIAAGAEIALKKRGWDDFFTVYALFKKQTGNFTPNLNSEQFVLGINFMPFNIKR